ncbi:MAG TPA: hypothetical protein VF460_15760 [Burkholderiales bacterium]
MDINDDPEVRAARKRWLAGGSALPVVELLASRGAKIEAGTYARLALAKPDCPDAAELKAVLAGLSSPPSGWDEALAGFARAPSADTWRDLIRFVPEDSLYLRLRDVVVRLRELGLDGDTIFQHASEAGLTPDLIELVEQGGVSVRTLEHRAAHAGGAKSTYFGLAAQAAFLRGDMLGTVRLLRQSLAYENDLCSAYPHVEFIRERATPAQVNILDRAGIPLLE